MAAPTCFLFLHIPKTGGTTMRAIFTANDYAVRRVKFVGESATLLQRLSARRCDENPRVLFEIHGYAHGPTLFAEIAATRARLRREGAQLFVFTVWRSPLDLTMSTYFYECGTLKHKCHDGPLSIEHAVATVRRDLQCSYLLGLWGTCGGWSAAQDDANAGCRHLKSPTDAQCETALGVMLHQIDLIGTTEALAPFVSCLNRTRPQLALRTFRPRHNLMVNTNASRRTPPTEAQAAALLASQSNDVWMDVRVRSVLASACAVSGRLAYAGPAARPGGLIARASQALEDASQDVVEVAEAAVDEIQPVVEAAVEAAVEVQRR